MCIVASFKLSCVYCCSPVCIVVILCAFVVLCALVFFFGTLDAGLLARSQYSECPAISTQVFLGFPVSISKC